MAVIDAVTAAVPVERDDVADASVWRVPNQDGGVGFVPSPCVSVVAFCDGSGWAGGQCHGEWIDRWFADEEA